MINTNARSHQNLADFFAECVAKFSDQVAFTCLGHNLTYGQLDDYAQRLAVFFQQHWGLRPGDKLAIQLPNLLQYPIAVLAAMKAGLVVVNTNPMYTRREMAHQFSDAGVRAVVVLADFADKLAGVHSDTGIEHVLVTEVADLHPAPRRWLINGVLRLKRLGRRHPRVSGVVSFPEALARGSGGTLEVPSRGSEDVALLQYTGGTTGVAKGAMLSHGNLLSNIQQVEDALGSALHEGRETMIAPLPVYHIFAFMLCMLLGIGIGARVVLIPDPRKLNRFVRSLRGVPFTFFAGLNTLFNHLCRNRHFRALDFSQLRITVSGGMALTHDTAERWEEVTGCKVIEGYGLTEASPVVAINPVDRPKLGTVGKLLPDTDLRLLDGTGEEVPQGKPGELWVRGPQVMLGYWNRPDETREMLDEQGWLHTGDVAVVDDEGYLSIVDRIKDMIVVSGFNVYPNELENEISRHPDIVECAAVGVPDPDSVEAVKLFVVSSNPALTAEEVRDFARQKLTGYKVPRQVEFVKELPKSNVGKVLRRALRDQG
ncbi:MAG: long-chain fatty acid--CoA ligase [Porticoccaceae bacterium]|nr:long-chain fatty acid--CoA ligase [Porticoccaceae bacterium]